MKRKALGIVSVGGTLSEAGNVVEMDTPQIHQGPRRLTCVF